MAERCLLHKNRLDRFEWWLKAKGYEIQKTKGIYEVLRAKKGKDTVIVFQKIGAKEHLTVQQKDHGLVRQFIKDCRENLWDCISIELLSEVLGTEDGN